MYLSILSFDMKHPSVRQALKNPQDMHRNLMKAFDDLGQSRERVRLLYRLDEGKASLLVSSDTEPNWERVTGYHCEGMKNTEGLKEVFTQGKVLRYELLAIPSKKVKGEGKNSRRVFLRESQEREEWLARQGKKYGFDLCATPEQSPSKIISGKKQDMEIAYTAVCFSGLLRIIDPEAFWTGYTQGIGAGKAYGLGMLSVAKV